MNRIGAIWTSGLRLLALGALATTMLLTSSAQAAPALADPPSSPPRPGIGQVEGSFEITAPQGYWSQPSYQGDCKKRPPSTVCLGFPDGYKWLIGEPVLDWEEGTYQGKQVVTAVGPTHKYHHVLGTDLVLWVTK